MRNFDYTQLNNTKWDSEIMTYVANIHEYKGRQEVYLKSAPKGLERLVEIAKIQSTEASNSIEGIRTTSTRLRQLLGDKTTPRNRDEEEIAGYRDALNTIHENYEYIDITSNYILQLHKILYSHSARDIGGKYKNVQNYISAMGEDGKLYTLFTPLAPYETPTAIDKICTSYNYALSQGVEPLVMIPLFIHDFLCIHPFLDGNGRMSRLLTTLLLYKSGYNVGKYASLEMKISKQKSMYYDSLALAQQNWSEGNEDATPFIKFMLGVILSAYRDTEERLLLVSNNASPHEMICAALENVIGKFTKQDIVSLCPTLGIKTIESVLKSLLDDGKITKHGASKSTFYTKNN